MFAILFALMQIGNRQDYEKKIKDIRRGGPPVCPANAHGESLYFVITFFIEVIERSCCYVLFAIHGGAVPPLLSLIRIVFNLSAGKALINSTRVGV